MRRSLHDRIVEETERNIENVGFDPSVDHLPGRDQPDELGGRIPDLSFDHPGPGRTFVEVDSSCSMEGHDRQQMDDFQDAARPEDRLFRVTPCGTSEFDTSDDGLLDFF